MITLAFAPFGDGQHRSKGPLYFCKPGISSIDHKLLFYNLAKITTQRNIIKITLSSAL
jgi:hypothetical protein